MNLNIHNRRIQMLSALVSSFFALATVIAGQTGIGLRVVVLEGNRARAVVSRAPTGPITLRVVDASNRAVSGATIVFTSPESGPSCYFLNGSHSMILFTDQQGLAVAQNYPANSAPGVYQIQVQAAYMGEVATVAIMHTNLIAKKSSGKMFLIGAAAGGAVAAIWAVKAAHVSSPTLGSK